MSIHKEGTPIEDLADWLAHGGPKDPTKQWVDGRSAMELARHWLKDGPAQMPRDVAALLASHPDIGPVTGWHAQPEVKLPFDAFAGEPRNTDLLVNCTDAHGDFLVAVEGKADEPFGDTVGATLLAALEIRQTKPRSRRVDRVLQLMQAVMPPAAVQGSARLEDLRYQLFTAVAGLMCKAQHERMSRALLLIHTFDTDKTRPDLHARNAQDLDRFMHRLTAGAVVTVPAGQLLGPFGLPGAPLFDPAVRLYVGKITTVVRR